MLHSITQDELDTIVDILRNVARTEILPRFRGALPNAVRAKSSQLDLVTDADLAAELKITILLKRYFPTATVIGEEAVARDPKILESLVDAPFAIIIDPIDGTKNFSAGLPLFGVMASVVQCGEIVGGVILDPIEDAWAYTRRGYGAWFKRSDGSPTQLAVSTGRPIMEMTGIVSWMFFPPELRSTVSRNLSNVAAAVDYRCAAHQYCLLAKGHYDFALYSKLMPWDHAAGWLLHMEAGGYAACLDGSPYNVYTSTGGILCAPDAGSWVALHRTLMTKC